MWVIESFAGRTRLINAEGDYLPGLIIDCFGNYFSVQISTAGMERYENEIIAALQYLFTPQGIILRNDLNARQKEGLTELTPQIIGDIPDRITVLENDFSYLADIKHGQKTGWYYDLRAQRAAIAQFATDTCVLDAFCHTGGFGLLAAQHGASDVYFLDSSQAALSIAQETAVLHKLTPRCHFFVSDCSKSLQTFSAEQFDIIVLDPPPFAKTHQQVPAALRAYAKLLQQAMPLLKKPGILMLAACSYYIHRHELKKILFSESHKKKLNISEIYLNTADDDHPIHPLLKETHYLSVIRSIIT